ncbi:MAG TPA: substrate-binding domain-containing protein [Puia sp.]|nr:substrate-binding domain-containing protein [Puia sp.]
MPENNQTKTIGVILPTLGSYFISSAIKGIEEIANRSGYDLIVTNSQESREKEVSNVRLLLDSGVDGVIASLATPARYPAHFAGFGDKGIPIVFFDRVPETGGCYRVTIDNTGCGYRAAEHLIRQGCTRMAFIASELERKVYAQRYGGFRKALESYGASFAGELIVPGGHGEEAGSMAVKWITAMSARPDGLFIANDLTAAICLQALTEAGVRVPEDIAVMGFNNDPIGRLVAPTLTTIDYSGFEMGKTAASRLFCQLAGHRLRAGNVMVIASGLVLRNSSLKKELAMDERRW